MNCSACSIELAEAARFCPSCGQAVTEVNDATQLTVPHEPPPSPTPPPPLKNTPPQIPPASEHSHHASSHSTGFLQGRFLPGTVLADRYRIVAPLGKGGMGEVYRADDLKLNQTVALKFLPRELTQDAKLLEYFHSEVRLSRQVSHPNVCRVYDIGEIEGQHFLSMEFIDGEDLRALLRRIGRLPKDKGIDLARQLCAGLAAAHDKGVLHRDLKPANIMIDGRGQARITDFGLAAIATEIAKDPSKVGTPAYMAPEQLTHGRVTIQSDLYALGLILYEMFTGKRAYTGASIADLMDQHTHSSVTSPGDLIEDMDGAVERVMMRCLERDATQRPKSVGAVAAALPGGDPLAAALAAGETPSPEMVAAAGGSVGLKPKTAVMCLVSVAVLLIGVCLISERTKLINQIAMPRPPAALVDRAQQVLDNLGYDEAFVDSAYGFNYDDGDQKELLQTNGAEHFHELVEAYGEGYWPGKRFWYRQAPFTLSNTQFFSNNNDGEVSLARVELMSPTPDIAGEAVVMLDPEGRLRNLKIVPDQSAHALEAKVADDAAAPWGTWFPEQSLGFDLDSLSVADWRGVPSVMADRRMAWEGVWPNSDQPLYVEAASFRGQPVHFRVAHSSYVDAIDQEVGSDPRQFGIFIAIILLVILIFSSGSIAWHNYQRRRIDRRGTLRLWTTVAALSGASWCLLTSHTLGIEEFDLFALGISQVMWNASLTCLFYIALEPYVRRYWPQTLITWSRIVDGRMTDPLVGRDLLVGVIGGCLGVIFFQSNALGPAWLDIAGPGPFPNNLLSLLGPAPLLGTISLLLAIALRGGLYNLLVMFLLRVTLRNAWLAGGAYVVIMGFMWGNLSGGTPAFYWLPMGLFFTMSYWVMVRFGLFAVIVLIAVIQPLTYIPITTDTTAWYAPGGFFVIALVAALAVVGFRISLGGRKVFGEEGG